jgi:Leucine-rich repeat (LRR) protein
VRIVVFSFHIPLLFVSFKTLCLGMNCLKDLPLSITSVKRLAMLNVDHNRLETLPQSFRFPRLRELSAQGNKLVDLPQAMRECKELQVLNLRGNQFQSYDFATLATTLPKLRLLTTSTVDRACTIGDGGK